MAESFCRQAPRRVRKKAVIIIRAPPVISTPSTLERWSVRSILALFVAITLDEIHDGTSWGQDFSVHHAATQGILSNPSKWFYLDSTSRPLLYWVGGFCSRFTRGIYTYQLASIVFALLGALALFLMYDASRRFISAPALRVSALALIAFLPVTTVTTVVYAADTAALLPFALAGWSLANCVESDSIRRSLGFAALACVALVAGNFAKATFLILPAAIVFALLCLLRTRQVSWRRSLGIVALTVIVPCGVGSWLSAKAKAELANVPPRHTFDWGGTGELTVRTLLLPKLTDRRVFDAPSYLTNTTDPKPVTLILIRNSFSYPALLLLGTFTDVLDFSENQLGVFTARPEVQQRASIRSIEWGLLFFVSAVAAVVAFWIRALARLVRASPFPSRALLLWSALAMVWFAPIACALPFVHHAYEWGYWLPRLVLPAIWVFLLTIFAAADRLSLPFRSTAIAAVPFLTAILCAYMIRSVWF
jgi:hypothetical protein